MLRRLSFAIVVILVAAVTAYALLAIGHRVTPSEAGSHLGMQDYAQIQRGRYLTIAADCEGCHTLPGQSKLAGGRQIETPFGVLVAPNITADRQTGVGAWSDEEFVAALRRGRRPDGSLLYPAMPYPYYTKMTKDDVLAIRAYLNTLPAIHNAVTADTLPFPLSVREIMYAWNELYFKKGEYKWDRDKSSQWNRGAYLVEGPGHCGACHTPKTLLGGDDEDQKLQGYALQGWFAPDITNDETRGVGRWSVEDIVSYLRSGHNAITAAAGTMAEEISLSSSKMTDDDLKAIATYLKDQKNSADRPASNIAPAPQMQIGEAIYKDTCSACHGLDGTGVANLFPSLAASPNVRSNDPTSLVRIVLEGARGVATDREPTAAAMPSYAWQLDDAQIAAVLTFVRNAWGAAAAPVSETSVTSERKSMAEKRY